MNPDGISAVRAELEAGIALPKCQKCGCMLSALENLAAALTTVGTDEALALAASIAAFAGQMRPVQYSCLGCDYCYPAVAQNAFAQAFPAFSQGVVDLSCEFRVHETVWPPVVGEYFVLDKDSPVAVSTLASVQLAEELAHRKPEGLAIVGKTETENIGIDKVIKNVISSPAIRWLIIAGQEPKGHYTGQTFLALAENGVDENGRVLGAPGKHPDLRNVTGAEIQAFREQVQVLDMIGCEDPAQIGARTAELARLVIPLCGCSDCGGSSPVALAAAPRLLASEPEEAIPLDKAGYFVIMPLAEKGLINVEYYAYDNTLIQVIEGPTARAIYTTLIEKGWVTELSHAAYLGKELVKAELSLQHGFKYVQDGA